MYVPMARLLWITTFYLCYIAEKQVIPHERLFSHPTVSYLHPKLFGNPALVAHLVSVVRVMECDISTVHDVRRKACWSLKCTQYAVDND